MKYEYMKRAIGLSKLGIGRVNPNPLVGAVIVKDDKIIGEGYHEYFGGNHAEINAFENAETDVTGADIYVTLEPCSHHGKTPPCVDKIIEKKISKVFIGMKDPNPLVMGRGINKLMDHGIEVEVGLCEDEILKLNEIFTKYITTKVPFCIMKTAMTLDGKIATRTGESKWITNEKSRAYVHQLRNRVAAIMVGIGTVNKDNPSLTTRIDGAGGSNPIKVIVDSHCSISADSKVFLTGSKATTIIAVTDQINNENFQLIKEKAEIITTPNKDGQVDLVYLFERLGEKGIDSVLIEGGGNINYSAVRANIVDKLVTFIAPKIFGGRDALTSFEGEGIEKTEDAILLKKTAIYHFDEDIMIESYLS
ncbi:MAG: riboflavin biosynthesis protein RibD [Firmicutes bacterium HGW-Firmicutes-7]|nr:MAG: riboflavin biosynthesis protein RibD [Firmicutes bacterium HGW-Firmicutes-7]